MKIYDSQIGGAAAGTQASQEVQQAGRSTQAGTRAVSDASGDRVEFSSTLGRLSRVISTSEGERASLVRTLSAAYQNGTYKVDTAAVSRGMMAEMLGSSAPKAGLH
jgi:flagellar biosynthesis anti-sigma factor FlgM